MWQYYVLMVLSILALIGGIKRYGEPSRVVHYTTSHVVFGIIVCSVMLWMQYTLLSVNWMWLSYALMTVAILNSSKMLFEMIFLRSSKSADPRYGTLMIILTIIFYTIFYIKFV